MPNLKKANKLAPKACQSNPWSSRYIFTYSHSGLCLGPVNYERLIHSKGGEPQLDSVCGKVMITDALMLFQ